jgi:hypothetical protein
MTTKPARMARATAGSSIAGSPQRRCPRLLAIPYRPRVSGLLVARFDGCPRYAKCNFFRPGWLRSAISFPGTIEGLPKDTLGMHGQVCRNGPWQISIRDIGHNMLT